MSVIEMWSPPIFFIYVNSLVCPQVTYRVVQVTDDQLEATADATGAVSVVSTAAFAGAPQAVAQVSKHTVRLQQVLGCNTQKNIHSLPIFCESAVVLLVDRLLPDATFSRLLSRTLSAMGAVLAARLWEERHVSLISLPPPSAMEQPRPCRCRPPPNQRSHRQEVRKRQRLWHTVLQKLHVHH